MRLLEFYLIFSFISLFISYTLFLNLFVSFRFLEFLFSCAVSVVPLTADFLLRGKLS